jgi:sugar-specific transcriptional regulator TrmB
MSKVNEHDIYMKEIFDEQDEANEQRLKYIANLEEIREKSVEVIDELTRENKLLWETIDNIRKEINKV